MTAIRIMHVAESARGGVGTYLNQMLPELIAHGDRAAGIPEMRVVMPAEHRFMLGAVPDAAILTYRREQRRLLPLLRLAVASWREIRAFRPHVIHCHSSFAGLMVRPLAAICRILLGMRLAVVYSPHGWAFQISTARWKQRLIVMVERMLARITDRIVTLSDAERQECIRYGFAPEKLIRIYNGIAIEAPASVPAEWRDDRLKVFFVGRFDRQKGLDTLIEAARLAPDKIVVRCAGASVVEQGPQIAAPHNVYLLGWLDSAQIEGQFRAADIVAVPSRWEGFGLVAIEAMRAGLPVVASRVGGLPEVVEDGVTGRLVPPEDPAALLEALLQDDAPVRKRMAEAGRIRFANHFTAERSGSALMAVYRALAKPQADGVAL